MENKIKQYTDEKSVVLATKVRRSSAELFDRLCRIKGLNKYTVLQMFVDVWNRYADDVHNLSQDMEILMSLFEHAKGWNTAFNLADPVTEREIAEAIYIIHSADRDKRGGRAVLVNRPFFGQWTSTYNVQTIMERAIEVLMPELYRRLRALAVDMECNSILELLLKLVDEHSNDADAAIMRKEFEDARHDYGKAVEYGQRTKKVRHTDPDLFEQEEAKRKERKAQEASKWLNENTDFRPHGYEW